MLRSPTIRVGGRRCRPALVALTGALIVLGGCRNAPLAFGTTRATAAANASDFFSGAARRFTNVQRDAKFAAARSKLGRSALTPSRIFGDSAVWTARGTDDRTLRLAAGYANGRYLMRAVPTLPRLAQPGDASHTIGLQRIPGGNDEYAWTTNVDFAIGRVTAADAANVVGSLLRATEGRTASELRADYRSAFPRASAALGRLFTIDAIRTMPDASGATMVELSMSLHSERLRGTFPAFANYVDKYVAPSRHQMTVTDRTGARFFTTSAAKNRITLRARVKDGRLVAFDGPPRPMPDALRLHTEAFAKFGIFTVGATDLVSEMTVVRTPKERGWFLRFNKEPDWHLPLAAATLLKTPLRRPFAGEGMTFRLTVRDAPGAQTVLARQTRVAVQESAVLRFLGALGASALSDYAGQSEEEENRFWAEAFQAMRADAAALTVATAATPAD